MTERVRGGWHSVNINFGLWCLLLHFGTKICEGSMAHNYTERSVLRCPFEQRDHENFWIDKKIRWKVFMLAWGWARQNGINFSSSCPKGHDLELFMMVKGHVTWI